MRGHDAWNSLSQIIKFLTGLLTISSQIALILNLSRSTGGPINTFAMICFIKPIFETVFSYSLGDKGTFSGCSTLSNLQTLYLLFIVWFGYVDNKDRIRIDALAAFAGDKYRQDIISNNIGEWIINGQHLIYFN